MADSDFEFISRDFEWLRRSNPNLWRAVPLLGGAIVAGILMLNAVHDEPKDSLPVQPQTPIEQVDSDQLIPPQGPTSTTQLIPPLVVRPALPAEGYGML